MELDVHTIKYFGLALAEFLPYLKKSRDDEKNPEIREELNDMIEAYADIATKIDRYGLNFDDPNKAVKGEPMEIEIDLSVDMVKELSMLTHRLLLAWKEQLEKIKRKKYLTEENKDRGMMLEHLIWPLENLLKAPNYVIGKYSNLGPLKFPSEKIQDPQIDMEKLIDTKPEDVYDVALSFAGEDREIVTKVANELTKHGVKVFFDAYETATLWGKDLGQHFDEVFRKKAGFVILFVSKHYVAKPWPQHEFKSALSTAILEKREYLLPVRIDNSELIGLQPTIAYLKESDPVKIAQLFLEKRSSLNS